MNSYTALLSQEGVVWLIEAVDLQGVRSLGRTVSSAVDNVREAIAAAEDLDEWGDLDLMLTVRDEGTAAALDGLREAKRHEDLRLRNVTRRSRMQLRRYEQKECHIATSVPWSGCPISGSLSLILKLVFDRAAEARRMLADVADEMVRPTTPYLVVRREHGSAHGCSAIAAPAGRRVT